MTKGAAIRDVIDRGDGAGPEFMDAARQLRQVALRLADRDPAGSRLCSEAADVASSRATRVAWLRMGRSERGRAVGRLMRAMQQVRDLTAVDLPDEWSRDDDDDGVYTLLRSIDRLKRRHAEAMRQLEAERGKSGHLRDLVRGTSAFALVSALEARFPDVAEHSERLGRSAGLVASCMGQDAEESVVIRLGAYLHDIGKVGIPESILLSCAPLDEAEWAIMRTHPVIGSSLLQQLGSLAACIPIVRHHHERFDGSGYPDGLRGAGVPIGARITAVVDAYDAMRSDRPYSAAVTREIALSRLVADRGRQFDPDVVDAFVTLEVPEPAGPHGALGSVVARAG